MKRSAIKRWVGACLLGSALATGCSHYRCGVNDPPARIAQPVARPTIDRPVLAQHKVEHTQAQAPKNVLAQEVVPATALEEKDTVKAASITQTALDSSRPSPVGQSGSVSKAFLDITAHPCFNHAEDYGWLSGQLQHSRKGWRLRYASVDEVDPYGGSVTLTDDARLSGLRDGDFVRVHGRLVNPEERGIAPPYAVDTIQAIEKQE